MSEKQIQQWAGKFEDPHRASALAHGLARRIYLMRVHHNEDSTERQRVELLIEQFTNERERLTPQRLQALGTALDAALSMG
jgi:hypothetical protein